MFPTPITFTLIVVIACCAIGLLIGIVSGIVICLALRIPHGGTWKDAISGALAVPIGYIVAAIIPVPQHAIVTTAASGKMTEIVRRFQHPLAIGFVLALVLPVLRRVYNLKRGKRV